MQRIEELQRKVNDCFALYDVKAIVT